MESYSIFRDLAIIIIFAKVFGIIARKCKAPQVDKKCIAQYTYNIQDAQKQSFWEIFKM